MNPTEPVSRLALVLAASPEPVSIDQLVAWNLARPSELWRYLGEARGAGNVEEVSPGAFRRAGAGAIEVLDRATAADWTALVEQPELIPVVCAASHELCKGARYRAAGDALRALVAAKPHTAFPEGERGWMRTVVTSIRLVRAMYGITRENLERALEVAVAHGDLASQAVLHAALGLFVLFQHRDPGEPEQHFRAAREASEALANPRIRDEVHAYIAISLFNLGRIREATAAFEELLGDVPNDIFATDSFLADLKHPTPGMPVVMLMMAWAYTGQVPRAIELAHRMIEAGLKHEVSGLEQSGRLGAAMVHLVAGEFPQARPLAEAAFDYWRAVRAEPMYHWFAASTLAQVRAAEGNAQEARAVLETGCAARRAAGWPPIGAPGPLRAFDRLEGIGALPPEIDMDTEVERLLAYPSPFLSGGAHSLRAVRLARKGELTAERIAEIDALHQKAIALVRESGAVRDLGIVLEAASTWAEQQGRAEQANALRTEHRELVSPVGASTRQRDGANSGRLTAVILELGRLATLGQKREGLYGDILARLCAAMGAERGAFVEMEGAGAKLIAARGGGAAWHEALLRFLCGRPIARPELVPALGADGRGRLVLVPLVSRALARQGWVCLENREREAAIGPEDVALLDALGVQLGVVLENVMVWRELTAARQKLEEENRFYRSAPAAASGGVLIGDSPALRRVLEMVDRVAPTPTPVLVTGETGVGKELVASEIHRRSGRGKGPFIAVHIASMVPGLVASGLFGHERGAFTGATEQVRGRFELADGGTLFLDEIGELGAEDQVRLLRVLQEGTFERVGGTRPLRSDFRLVCATNRDLAAEVRAGRFREDLFFRINVFPVKVPPLRERREEIPTLALYFMERAARKLGVKFEGISESDMARLVEYGWPGNVRELEHLIDRAAILSEPPRLRIPTLGDGQPKRPAAPAVPAGEWVTMEESERRYLAAVIRHTGGRITGAGGAAEILGMKPSTVNFRIDKLGLKDELARVRGTARGRSAS